MAHTGEVFYTGGSSTGGKFWSIRYSLADHTVTIRF
eukprot:gene10034-16298_t